MEAAQSFDRDDAALAQQATNLADDRKARVRMIEGNWRAEIVRHDQRKRWPAVRAGVGLGVKTAIGRIFVLMEAALAHRETGHGGQRPVVGNFAGDRIARSAIGAVGKRIAVAAIGRRAEIAHAVIAGGNVGRNRDQLARHIHALANHEAGVSGGAENGHSHVFDLRERRGIVIERAHKLIEFCFRSLGFNDHAGGGIEDVAGKLKPLR